MCSPKQEIVQCVKVFWVTAGNAQCVHKVTDFGPISDIRSWTVFRRH